MRGPRLGCLMVSDTKSSQILTLLSESINVGSSRVSNAPALAYASTDAFP